jgi:hypothetical protein
MGHGGRRTGAGRHKKPLRNATGEIKLLEDAKPELLNILLELARSGDAGALKFALAFPGEEQLRHEKLLIMRQERRQLQLKNLALERELGAAAVDQTIEVVWAEEEPEGDHGLPPEASPEAAGDPPVTG